MANLYRYTKVAHSIPTSTRYKRYRCDICGEEKTAGGAGLRMHFEEHVRAGEARSERTFNASFGTSTVTFYPLKKAKVQGANPA